MILLAGGLGCQNAKDTQNLQQGYGALDLKDYQRAIAAADDYLQKHPNGKWGGGGGVSPRASV